jgi:hypothetical protein
MQVTVLGKIDGALGTAPEHTLDLEPADTFGSRGLQDRRHCFLPDELSD